MALMRVFHRLVRPIDTIQLLFILLFCIVFALAWRWGGIFIWKGFTRGGWTKGWKVGRVKPCRTQAWLLIIIIARRLE